MFYRGTMSRLPLRRLCPDTYEKRGIRLPNATSEPICARVRHLLHSSARWCDGLAAGVIASHLDVRRSIVPRIEVNLIRMWPLSIELCSKFLNESPPPVNIAYGWQLLSRVCDMSGPNGLLS
jgi:hypothetical protein